MVKNLGISTLLITMFALLVLMTTLPVAYAQNGTTAKPTVDTSKPPKIKHADTMTRAGGGSSAGATGFSCDATTHECKCRMSTPGDCAMMKSLVCKTVPDCPGSSQTCTCKSIK